MSDARAGRRAVVHTLAANFAVLGLSILTGVLSARLLGVEGRGQLAALMLIPQMIFMISVLGVHEAVVFHVARREFSTPSVLGSALILTAPLAVASTALSIAIVPTMLSQYAPPIRLAAQLFSLYIPLALLHGVLLRVLQGRGFFGWWSQFRVLFHFNSLVVIVTLWAMGRLTPANFALWFLASYVCVLCLTVLLFQRLELLGIHVQAASVRALWSYSWRAGLSGVPQLLNMRLDQAVIAVVLNAHALGLYATAVSWSSGFLPLADAFGAVLFTSVAGRESTRAAATFSVGLRRALAVLVISWIVFVAITPLAFRVVYGPQFVPAMPSVIVLAAASLFLGANQILAQGIKGLGLPMLVSMAELCGLAATTGLLLALVGRLEIFGAALASLGAYMLTSVILLIGLRKATGIAWHDLVMARSDEWRSLLRDALQGLTAGRTPQLTMDWNDFVVIRHTKRIIGSTAAWLRS